MGITIRSKLEKIVSEAPDTQQKAQALYDLAAHLDEKGVGKEAWQYYEQAIKAGLDDATHAQALTFLGSTYYNLGERRKALLKFEEARHALQTLPKLPSCTIKGKPILAFVRYRLEELRGRNDKK
ncbi:MAG: tetratricopeptide repeat protein [Elusimicrobia bacterium]|nr:tetratricopeptide repeat protein [Elusimicrobiota bacterium]